MFLPLLFFQKKRIKKRTWSCGKRGLLGWGGRRRGKGEYKIQVDGNSFIYFFVEGWGGPGGGGVAKVLKIRLKN